MISVPTHAGEIPIPQLLGDVLSDVRVQECLWVGLMEWGLKIQDVALRPRFAAEGGTHPNGWVLCVGLGPGVRLEVLAGRKGTPVQEVRLIVAPATAPKLIRKTMSSAPSLRVRKGVR